MRELRLTDIELQRLIAPALKKRLRQEGFEFGTPEGRSPGEGDPEAIGMIMFPVNLDLAGCVSIERGDDGVWTFRQDTLVQLQRFYQTLIDHHAAIEGRDSPVK